MNNRFRTLPDYDLISACASTRERLVIEEDVTVQSHFGDVGRCYLQGNHRDGETDIDAEMKNVLIDALRMLPRPSGGSFSDVCGNAILHIEDERWTYRYRGSAYEYAVESSDAGETKVTVSVALPATLTDVAAEIPKEGYRRRTSGIGKGMLPTPDHMKGSPSLHTAENVMIYAFDANGHLSDRPLVKAMRSMTA